VDQKCVVQGLLYSPKRIDGIQAVSLRRGSETDRVKSGHSLVLSTTPSRKEEPKVKKPLSEKKGLNRTSLYPAIGYGKILRMVKMKSGLNMMRQNGEGVQNCSSNNVEGSLSRATET